MLTNNSITQQTLHNIKNDFIKRAASDFIDSFNCVLADDNCADLSRYVEKGKPLRSIIVEPGNCNLSHRSIICFLKKFKSINDSETIVIDCDDFSAWRVAGNIYSTSAEDLHTAPRRFKNVVLLNSERYFGRYIFGQLIDKLIDLAGANIIIHTNCPNLIVARRAVYSAGSGRGGHDPLTVTEAKGYDSGRYHRAGYGCSGRRGQATLRNELAQTHPTLLCNHIEQQLFVSAVAKQVAVNSCGLTAARGKPFGRSSDVFILYPDIGFERAVIFLHADGGCGGGDFSFDHDNTRVNLIGHETHFY